MKFLMCVEREDEDYAIEKKRERHTHILRPPHYSPTSYLRGYPLTPYQVWGTPSSLHVCGREIED